MKNTPRTKQTDVCVRTFGIAAFAAVIGFSRLACDNCVGNGRSTTLLTGLGLEEV